MFFYISKLLSFFTYPAVWIFGLLLWTFLSKNPKRKKKLLLVTLLFTYLVSNSFINSTFMRWWEVAPTKETELKAEYDAAIILGGFTSYDEEYNMVGFHENADRVLHPLRLYKKGIIKKLIISGGSGSLLDQHIKESRILKKYLTSIGVPSEDIIIEDESRNTYENAINTVKIIEDRFERDGNYLLVTSGYHMRRASACFQKQGLQITPYSTDMIAGPFKWQFDYLFIPKSDNMQYWHTLLHEWIGYVMYLLLGFV